MSITLIIDSFNNILCIFGILEGFDEENESEEENEDDEGAETSEDESDNNTNDGSDEDGSSDDEIIGAEVKNQSEEKLSSDCKY